MKFKEIHAFGEAFNGKTPSKAEQRTTGLPILKIRDIDENGKFRGNFESFVDEEFYTRYSKKKLKTGDTIILNAAHNSDYVGSKNALVPPELNGIIATGEWLIVRVSPAASYEYINHFLKSPMGRRRLKTQVKGIHLYPKDVERIKVPEPPFNDQIRIAHLLSKVEGLIAQRKQNLQQLDDLLKSVFLEMFGDPVRNERGWDIKPLGSISEVQGGLQVTTKRKDHPVEVPYLRVANVYRDRLNLTVIKLIRITDAELNRVRLKKGDLLIVEGHGNPEEIGRSAVWDGSIVNCVHQNHLIRVRVDTAEITEIYASFFINSVGGRIQMFRAGKTTSGLNTISSKNVKETKIPVPPFGLQNQFTAIVEKVEDIKSHYQQSLVDLENLYGALSQKAFKGELDLSRVVLTTEDTESTEGGRLVASVVAEVGGVS